MNALDRVYYFHELVRKNQYPTSLNIESVFQVTEATAKRDISYLQDRLMAPLVFDEEKQGYTYHSMFRLPFENNPRFLFFLSLINQMIRDSGLDGLPEVQMISDKLKSLMPESYRNVLDSIWHESVEIEYVDPEVIQGIIEALHLSQSVDFVYHSVKRERSERRVDPWRLLNYQGRWYLIGYCHERKGKRHFHCGRIRKMRPSGQKREFDPPENLASLEKGFGIFKGETTHDVRILFTGEAATVVKYQIWHGEQMIESVPGGIVLTVPVANETEIIMKVLQYGSNARVLEPVTLSEKIRHEVNKMHHQLNQGMESETPNNDLFP